MALFLTVAILLAYAAALWWLLRRETMATLAVLVALIGVAASLRLVYTESYPPGFDQDEPKVLYCAAQEMRAGHLAHEGCTGIPVLLNALFQAQLVPLIGPGRWAVRSYSMATSVLATPAAFGAARALGLAAAPSLAAAAFIATLPWSLFYGRMSLGGEMVFHELLLIAALAALVMRRRNGWEEAAAIAVGTLGQTLLLYDYYAGRAMPALCLGAALLARGRNRLWCVAIPLLALLLWTPFLRSRPVNVFGGDMSTKFERGYLEAPLKTLETQASAALETFVAPKALDGWQTIRTAAMHPPLILILAVIGCLTGLRRGLFLLGGFVVGLAPTLLSTGVAPSTHRLLMAFPFPALAAASALNVIPWRWPRTAVAAAAAAVIGFQGAMLYFSPAFWPKGTSERFDPERSALVEAIPLPPHPRLIINQGISYHFDPHKLVDHDYELLRVDNWFPKDDVASIYAFDQSVGALAPFYTRLLGQQRVTTFGRAFMFRLEARNWSWMRRHGWAYEVWCRDRVMRGEVPVLFQPRITFDNFRCSDSATHVWRGHWEGPETNAVFRFNAAGGGEIISGDSRRPIQPAQRALIFALHPDTDVTIRLITLAPEHGVIAELTESTPSGERVPAWERVTPVFGEGPGGG